MFIKRFFFSSYIHILGILELLKFLDLANHFFPLRNAIFTWEEAKF